MLQLVGKSARRIGPPRFKDLRIRPKLIVLHNLFFLVLTAAVYYSLIPLVERHAAGVQERETELLGEMFLERQAPLPAGGLSPEDRRIGTAAELGVPPALRAWLDANPGASRLDPSAPGHIYRKDPASGLYASLRIPGEPYRTTVARARLALFATLGAIYVLAVLALELIIMPRYVYRPIQAHLAADRAVQDADRAGEMIAESAIPGDEIGDIMRSRNATVRKLREKEATLESAKQGIAAQDRLATIGLLSASVAHELNTPLSVIRGSIEKLLETGSDPSSRKRLERIRRMTERLARISEGLLDFSRARRSEERQPVELRELLDEAWSLLALDGRAAQVSFSNRIEADTRVLGDYDRLMQVFINLLRNGVYAMNGGGAINVRSALRKENGRDFVSIAVEDTGPGIPADVLPNIFEAFISSRLDSRGTGLGLTVAEGIVQQHGGRIVAGNRPAGGASLEVTLPSA